MNLSRPFIVRPVATSLLMVALVLVGIVAYRQLPVSALPQVDYPTIQVLTFYPGASPEVMASSVTSPLERQFGQVPGLTQMTSSSSEGCSVIILRFDLALDIDVATQQVQAAINSAAAVLPRDLPNPPVYTKTNPADAPVLTLALTSDTLPLTKVQDLADTRLAQKISQLSGVGMVSISGGQKPAIRIQVNPTALSSLGMNLEDLRAALVQASVNQAKGSFDGSRQAFTIAANDQLLTSEQFRELIIGYRNDSGVRLVDVAEVVDGAENVRQAAWMNDTPAVIVNIQRQPGANIIEVVDSVKALLPQLEASLPAAVEVHVLTDRTLTIRASIEGVQHEMLLTIALVVFIIFLFLRSLTATLIPSVAVPLSLVGTFGVMHLLGYSLNNLTLMALTISTGFVVDDAIVMIENIVRYVEEGETPLAAALKGSAEIGFTIVSLSVSLIAVLIPLLFMGDIVGRLFREFAVTLSVTIVVSAAVSLTLTPMMCALLLSRRSLGGAHAGGQPGLFARLYAATLDSVLRHQVATMATFVATLLATWQLFEIVPKGFFPVQDTGVILGISEAPQSISFEAMRERQLTLNRVILADPAVESLSSFIGIDGTNVTLNSGRIQINLKPLEEREASAVEVIRRLQPAIAAVEGIGLFMQPVQDLSVETRVSRTQYQVSVESPDAAELAAWAPRFVAALRELPELADVASDQQTDGRQARLVIDRDSASRLGITPQMIDDALYDAFGQRQVSVMYRPLGQYRVVMGLESGFLQGPDSLRSLHVTGANGLQVPLESLATHTTGNAPLMVNHTAQFPSATVSFNLARGVSLGTAVEAVEAKAAELGMPSTVRGSFSGTAQVFREALANQPFLILAAVVTVYLVLGMLYESLIHPLTIISTLPSAGLGALLALQWTGSQLDVMAMIGIILLIGIVKKNAIMMIDFALEAERTRGLAPREAIFEACVLRFRPITMTTLAALLGGLPLALGTGPGAELRWPLGIAIVGGLIVSQMLTLFTTPVVYLYLDSLVTWLGRRRIAAPATITSSPVPSST